MPEKAVNLLLTQLWKKKLNKFILCIIKTNNFEDLVVASRRIE
jgi:hypothetical protein